VGSARSPGLDWPRAWLAVIVASAAAAAIASLIGLAPPVRAPLVLWFAAVCPGMSLVRLLHLEDRLVEIVLAVALSLSLAGIVAAAFLYSGHWSPPATMAVLIAITACAVSFEPARAWAGRRRARVAGAPAVGVEPAATEAPKKAAAGRVRRRRRPGYDGVPDR
jgi:hypothetical protein